MRVRFPPSPTGALHIGNARTALYNWLLARGSGGQLVLRIEDTDRERSTPENVELIFDSLAWLGIDWDGDVTYQSANAGRHAEVVAQLLESGQAYRSTAGPEQVKAFKEANGNRGFRGEDEGEGAVRLRMPDEGATVVRDIIRGESAFENVLQDDLVIARADGTPIYHLAVVVDDHDAGITHVVRGADHYSNTPKHMRIYAAMGAEPPTYAHLPLLHGPDGKKLSKRHGAASVQDLRNSGYLREAVINYLALLGWGYDEKTTFFTIPELQELFSLERVSKNPAVFDEQKLRWINGRYVRELSNVDLTARLEEFTGRTGLGPAVAITQEKISTLEEFWPLAGSFFDGPFDDPKAREKFLEPRESREALADAQAALAELPEPWTPENVEEVLRGVSERTQRKAKAIFQPLRVALTGTTVSPGIFETVALLGRDETLARVGHALEA
ncbi:glutamate--tRNA ligase [Solirubrobacter ginsenosidimutans]|uniref:Glutamate--tRNA ligase n=1 Tax=Solirubrobacter ginsenosidimutans TaxID=490573 RepID=A0A9X3MYV3_9ACTN|nr:glutamate--tRNA ligase [Solirubrobacter ginsenosidimutans]MDA0164156.1 glutamate--tRNA ligase [Solirubrobacter ginsenosidimutans]